MLILVNVGYELDPICHFMRLLDRLDIVQKGSLSVPLAADGFTISRRSDRLVDVM